MNRFLFFIFFLMFSDSIVSQNIKYNYTSNFAKLQAELGSELGLNSMKTVNFCKLSGESSCYSIQVIDNTCYDLFLKNVRISDSIRILYLDNIDFSKIDYPAFENFKNLKAIRINNCKNIDPEKFIYKLGSAANLEQLHFKNLNFKNWRLNVNNLIRLKVITFENCCLNGFENIALFLDEFSITKSKETLDLKNLKIESVKQVKIKECKIEAFPYGLSTSKELEFLDLSSTKINEPISTHIAGFKNLKFLDITDCKIKCTSIEFPDLKQKIYLINGMNIVISQ